MKLSILLACGAVATAACSSNNKPPADPTETAFEEPSSATPTPPERTQEASEESKRPISPLPASTDAQSTMPPPPPAAAPPGPAPAQESAAPSAPATMGTATAQSEPDNTRVNKRDRGSGAPTPMDQGNGSSDLKITQQIRQAVMADGTLSFTAKNVKIITTNGKVTLRGPVANAQERSAIEASARRVAGDTNVDNQIEVKK